MKNLKYLFTALLLLCATVATAHDFEVGGIYYNITSTTDFTVEVTYRGNSFGSYSDEYSGNVVIPESVTYNGSTYSVTSIGGSAFYYCSGLTSVVIPNSVTSIGGEAFSDCTGLKSVEIGNSVTSIGKNAFYRTAWYNNQPNGVVYAGKVLYEYKGTMSSNTSIAIKDGTLGIGNSAFWNCRGLTSVVIPNSVTSIGEYAFYGCSGLTSVVIGNGVISIGDYAFYGCGRLKKVINFSSLKFSKEFTDYGYVAYYADTVINAPNGSVEGYFVFGVIDGVNTLCLYVGAGGDVTLPADYNGENYAIGADVFKNNTSLTSVVIPNSVTSIGYSVFNGCNGLTSVEIPNSVTSIGNDAFYNCSGLTNVVIPNSVTSIGAGAFSGCSGLKSVEIGNSVTSIGDYAFNGCTSLKSLRIEDGEGILTLGYNTYNSLNIGKGLFYDCPLESVYLGRTLSYNADYNYGYSPFCNNTQLKSLTIGGKVTSIGFYAFYECSGLTSVVIPNSVTSIGYSAFNGCNGLTSVEIPNSVTSIGNDAFYNCYGLTNVVIGNGITSIGEYAFLGCSGLKKVINFSSLTFSKGSTYYGDVAYYADTVINAPNGSVEVDFVFGVIDSVNTLCGYIGAGGDVTLPADYKGEDYAIGANVFNNNTSLTSVEIPNSVTSIGWRAFYNCSGLASVVIPNSVTSIGSSAFDGCSGLKEVHISDLSAWCGIEFGANPLYYAHNLYLNGELVTDLVIPDGVTEIKGYAFRDCRSLTCVVIPNSVTSIGEDVFYGCSGLTSVTIGNSVTSIGEDVFYGCSGLTSVEIPNSVTSIGNDAFYNCYGLTNVVIGNGITSIGEYAFLGCSGLKKVINFSSLTFSKGSTDYGCVAYYADTVINAPNGSVEGDFVFAVIDGVNTLCLYVGAGGDVTLPADYKGENYVIGSYAFSYCSALTSVVIPNSVTSIGEWAFLGCSGLTGITSMIPAENLFSVTNDTFDYNCVLYVPKGAKETYASTGGWSNFENIVETDFTGVDEVKGEKGKVKDVYYDLNGRAVERPANGLYIKDGKKVFVK